MSDERVSLSGLTKGEAKEFHSIFVTSFIVFTLIVTAIAAWAYRETLD